MIIPQVNKTLHPSQLEGVLKTLFIDKPIKIIRLIPRTGRSQVSWVYLEHEISRSRRATFISFADLLDAFLAWVETLNIMLLAMWQRMHISATIWWLVNKGDMVEHSQYGWVSVVEKQKSENGILRFWIETDKSIEITEPCFVNCW